MTYVLIGLALLATLTVTLMLLRSWAAGRAPVAPLARAAGQGARAPRAVAPAPAAPRAGDKAQAAIVPARPMPDELAAFCWAGPDALEPDRRQALVAAIRNIPRPPAALHQLLSPQFLDRASSSELSELITGEAQIAAKVLATVNSPFYGLRQPVGSIGQAVTFLGLNTVRGICLQYLLNDSFKARHATLKQAYDQIWAASALASECCTKLSQKLSMSDNGTLVAQVLLSFLGHLASATLLLQHPSASPLAEGLLDRIRREQDELGLSAAEIGGLLLQEWRLPAAIIDEVREIDRMLVTPADSLPPQRSQRLAVAYVSARLGERLARAEAEVDLAGFDATAEPGADFFHLRAHLAAPALARLNDHLGAADLNRALRGLKQAVQTRH